MITNGKILRYQSDTIAEMNIINTDIITEKSGVDIYINLITDKWSTEIYVNMIKDQWGYVDIIEITRQKVFRDQHNHNHEITKTKTSTSL